MTGQNQSKYQENPVFNSGIRKIQYILNQKLTRRLQDCWQKFQIVSIIRSPSFLSLKGSQFIKRVSRIFTFKMRQNFSHLIVSTKMVQIEGILKIVQASKVKDRVYEAKVKSLRVLSRQWKQRKAQNMYKSKYFTPKSQQAPKTMQQKVPQNINLALKSLIRGKYLQGFNQIRNSEVITARNSKMLYLMNLVVNRKKYWLTSGFQMLKLKVLVSRESKNRDQISQLDHKLIPVADSQIKAVKQKQEKLQTALDAVYKQKQTVQLQIDSQIRKIQDNLDQKRTQLNWLKDKKQKILLELEQCQQKNCQFEFNKDQIFSLIYTNFLINLKLWSQMPSFALSNAYLSKSMVLQWLQVPVIDFHLDKVSRKSQSQLQQLSQNLTQLINQYSRLRKEEKQLQLFQLYQNFFSNSSLNQTANNCQQFLNKNKFTYKMLTQILKQNSEVIYNMIGNLGNNYQKVRGQNLQIRHE